MLQMIVLNAKKILKEQLYILIAFAMMVLRRIHWINQEHVFQLLVMLLIFLSKAFMVIVLACQVIFWMVHLVLLLKLKDVQLQEELYALPVSMVMDYQKISLLF